jgi:hypothetical protein
MALGLFGIEYGKIFLKRGGDDEEHCANQNGGNNPDTYCTTHHLGSSGTAELLS